MYPIKEVSFAHVDKGKLVRLPGVQPRGRQMLLQCVRDDKPLPVLIKLVWQTKGKQPIEITAADVDWSTSDITPSDTWTFLWDEIPPHDPACAECHPAIPLPASWGHH